MLQMHLAHLDVTGDFFSMDVDFDGTFDVSDVTKLQRIIVKA